MAVLLSLNGHIDNQDLNQINTLDEDDDEEVIERATGILDMNTD